MTSPPLVLEPAGRKEILDILLAAREQTTILFSTHILADVERICTESAFLNGGKIVMRGTIAQLKSNQASDGFIVETLREQDAERLTEAFGGLRHEQNALAFYSGGDQYFTIMRYIAEHKIAVQKIERI